LLHGRDQGSVPGSQGETDVSAYAAFFVSLLHGRKGLRLSRWDSVRCFFVFLLHGSSVVIRIGSVFNGVPGSAPGSRRAKMNHKHRKNKTVNQFHFLECWMFSFEGLRLLP
jgi:hypothetical protein